MRYIIICLLLLGSTILKVQTFSLESDDFKGQATASHFYSGFGCTGQNQSPQLRWKHAPAGTQSFAITMYDPDAPTGSGWWHWVVYNIPASVSELATNATKALPAGAVQGLTDFGTPGYGGPCPPAGDQPHRYIITVYALKVPKLDLPANASPALVGFNLTAQTIQKASIIVYGQR